MGESKGFQSSSKGGNGSTVIRIYFKINDIQKGFESIEGDKGREIGLGLNKIPIYGRKSELIGFFTETRIGTEDDCTIQGAFSIDPGRRSNQIYYQGTCRSFKEFPIVGGTGRFRCATGYSRWVKEGKSRIAFDLNLWFGC